MTYCNRSAPLLATELAAEVLVAVLLIAVPLVAERAIDAY